MPVGHHLERLGRQSTVYGAGGLLVRGIGVLLLPLYTAYLSPADYGVNGSRRKPRRPLA
jgi:O-antigen/teichoic acid export membrane protein